MNDNNENSINRNLYSFNKSRFFKKSFIVRENKTPNNEIDFKRATNACILNTEGEKPLVLYLKSPKTNYLLENKISPSYFDIPNYLSDGGLKQKRKKLLNLVSKYPINSSIKHNKEIIKNVNKRKYISLSLSFSNRKKSKNRTTTNKIKNYNEECNLLYKSNNKKVNRNLYNIENIKEEKKIKKELNNYFDNNDKLKKFYKKNLMKNIIKNKKFIKKIIKDKNPNLIFIERKKQLLKRNGIDLSLTEHTNRNINTIINKENNNININLNNEIKKLMKNKNIFNLKKIYSNNKEIDKKKNKTIDQFEYIKKIIKEQKRFQKDNKKINDDIKNAIFISNYNLKKSKMKNEKTPIVSKKYDKLKKFKNDSSYEETFDEYPYSHKKSHRAIEELKLFNKLKRIKKKRKSKEQKQKKKRKLYIRFKNLWKLNSYKINSERLLNNKDKTLVKKNNLIKKRKEINKYYIGNEINNSTLIEQNDYYYALYQSHQIISNSNIDITNKIIDYSPNLLISQNNINNGIHNAYNEKVINKFILIIKTIFAKKIFYNFFQNFSRIKYYYKFYLAINYLIAITKQYAFNKLYLYNINEKEICKSRNKINCFSEILTLIFKYKIFEKIVNYSKQKKKMMVGKILENLFNTIKNNCIKRFFKNLIERSSDTKIINITNNININIINIDNDLEEEKNSGFLQKVQNCNQLKDITKIQKNENGFKLRNDDKSENIKYNLRYQENDKIAKNGDNENDISAERDNQQNIKIEYHCDDLFGKNIEDKNKIKDELNEPKIILDNDEYEDNFQDIKSFSEYSDILDNSNIINSKNKKEQDGIVNTIGKDKNIDFDIKNNDLNSNNNIKEYEKLSKTFENKKQENHQKFVHDLTEEIIKSLLNEEIISSNSKIIPNKIFKNEINSNGSLFNDYNNDIISKDLKFLEVKIPDTLLKEKSLNNSLNFSSSTYSIFNKNIMERKKEKSVNFYMDKIFPKLIKIIHKELIEKHKRIFDNISTPFTNNSKNIMISLALFDKKMFEENYKLKIFKEKLEDIIDKKSILKKLDKINDKIREKDNISNDNNYDRILNECIIDTIIELINKERINYLNGENLLWDKKENEIIGEHDRRNDPKKFSSYICKSLIILLNKKLGKTGGNLLNYEEKNKLYENELNNIIKEEINEKGKSWESLKIEETKVKLEVTEYIFEMLLRENIEILEHIENNRKRPELYNYKSIYNCTDMPKLEFQKVENHYFDDFEDDMINI